MPRPTRAVQFALAERLTHLNLDAWRQLTATASIFMQPEFLLAFEQQCPANVSPRYALMYLGDEPIAALVLQLVRVEGRLALAASVPFAGLAQVVDERALVLGNLAAWGETGLVMKPGADASVVWHEALTLVDRLRRFEKLEGVVNVSFVKDASSNEDEATLRSLGYQRAPSGPDMLLHTAPSWREFDDYLASLASKRRRAVKKTFEGFEAAGYVARRLTLDEVSANEDRLNQLYGEVWANADVRPLRLSGRFFVELQRRLGERCVITGLEKDGHLDGFGVSLKSGSTCIGYYLGYDKSVEAPLYLRLLMSVLEQAFSWRSEVVSLGRTAEEPKARLGAEPGAAGLWVKHRTPPLNWAVGTLLGSLEQPKVPSTHRVFRSDG